MVTSSKNITTSHKVKRTAKVVTKVGENDILLGRGAVVLRNEGNKRFRQLILSNKAEYNASGKHSVKDKVSRRILKIIDDRRGRFLRKLESEEERKRLGVSNSVSDAWEIIEEEEAKLLKVKQALREHESTSSSPPRPPPRNGRHVDVAAVKKFSGKKRSARRISSSMKSSPGKSDKNKAEPLHSEVSLKGDSGMLRNRRCDLTEEMVTEKSTAVLETTEIQLEKYDHSKSNRNDRSEAEITSDITADESSSSDLEFRLKHPSLRKLDLSRLRRRQNKSI